MLAEKLPKPRYAYADPRERIITRGKAENLDATPGTETTADHRNLGADCCFLLPGKRVPTDRIRWSYTGAGCPNMEANPPNPTPFFPYLTVGTS